MNPQPQPVNGPVDRSHAGGRRLVGELSRLGERHVERVGFAGNVSDEQIEIAVAVEIADADAHARLDPAGGVQGAAALDRFLLERAVVLVDPELGRLFVVGDEDVGPAVAGEIGADDAPAARWCVDPGLGRHVGERAVAVVVIERATARPRTCAARNNPSPSDRSRRGSACWDRRWRIARRADRDNRRDRNRRSAGRTPMMRLRIEPGGRGPVGEGAVAVVVIEPVGAEAGDEDVGQAPVVGVADGDAVRISAAHEAAGVGHFLERAIRLLMEEPIGNGLGELSRRRVADLQECRAGRRCRNRTERCRPE